MVKKSTDISRRDFLKQSATVGAGIAMGSVIYRDAFAASRDRVTIYQNTVADSINPYQQSSGSIYGNWQHVIEPLVNWTTPRRLGSACLPSRGNFKESAGCSNSRKASSFTTARR